MADEFDAFAARVAGVVDPQIKADAANAARQSACFLTAMSGKYADQIGHVDLNQMGSELMLYTDPFSKTEKDKLGGLIGQSNTTFFALADEAARAARELGLGNLSGADAQEVARHLLGAPDSCSSPAVSLNDGRQIRDFSELRKGLVSPEIAKADLQGGMPPASRQGTLQMKV